MAYMDDDEDRVEAQDEPDGFTDENGEETY